MIVDVRGVKKKKSAVPNQGQFNTSNCLLPDSNCRHITTDSVDLLIQYKGEPSFQIAEVNGLVLVFMGSVYLRNADATRLQEKQSGQLNATAILQLYSKFGIGVLKYLKGSFLLFVLDHNQNECFICNDRSGFFDLFYIENQEACYFSTDLSAFKKTFNLELDSDTVSILQHFLFDYPLSDYSFFDGVKALLPGQYLSVSKGHFERSEYFSYIDKLVPNLKLSWDDTLKTIPGVFNDAVDTIISEREKICAGLTSGFDSRTNLSRLANYPEKDTLYYSWGLPGSIELRVASNVTKAFGLKYKPIYLTDDFEHNYELYAHQSVMLSNGKGPVSRANHAYGYHLLTRHANFFLTGLVGSELLKPRNCGGYMFTQLFLDLLNLHSLSERQKLLEEAFDNGLGYLNTDRLVHYKAAFMERTLAYFNEYDSIPENHLRLYYFMLKDGFRNYFGHEIHSNRIYGHIISPYADDDFIDFLLTTPIPDLNRDAFKNSVSSKLKGTKVYLPIMQANLPGLLKIETGRHFKPQDIVSPFVHFHLARAYIKSKFHPKDDTFDTKRWARNLMTRNPEILKLSSDIFRENHLDETNHKTTVKLYSLKYFLHQLGEL